MIENVVVGVTTGVITGVTTAILVARRSFLGVDESAADDDIDAAVDDIDEAEIYRWAERSGRGEFGPFIARKAQTVNDINRSRRRQADAPWKRRWRPW